MERELLSAAAYDVALSGLARIYHDKGEAIPDCLLAAMNRSSVESVEIARSVGGDVSENIDWAMFTVAALEGEPAAGLH